MLQILFIILLRLLQNGPEPDNDFDSLWPPQFNKLSALIVPADFVADFRRYSQARYHASRCTVPFVSPFSRLETNLSTRG